MEIACPSCGAKHRTEDYPGAFEIPCACGYSILVPDEDSLAPEPPAMAPSFDDTPMAQESADEASKISIDDADEEVNFIDLGEEDKEQFSSLDLTPPEELPDEMPYDPFELKNEWNAPEASNNTEASDSEFQPEEEPTSPPEVNSDPTNEETQASSDASTPPPPQAPTSKLEAQDIVDRITLASVGYLTGPLFRITTPNKDEKAPELFLNFIKTSLKERPWLEKNIPQNIQDSETCLKNSYDIILPEVIAVEWVLLLIEHKIEYQCSAYKN